ncbi:MAG: recombinase family protein [Bacilli bacterium]|nr:recombinase family protein [Bacilli bacterium]
MLKVAIYARVSTEEQAEHGYSIEAQLDTLRQYCQLYHRRIVGEYVDRGVSGKEMTKRLELQRLLKDADEGVFEEVIVWKFNRMSRKTKDLLEIVDRLDRRNIYFRSFSENFDTATPMGRFALQMMGAVGELERNTIVENVKLGLKQRARQGFHNGGSCLGYQTVELPGGDRKHRKSSLEIVPEEAVVVRRIYSYYVTGRGFRSIANQLNKEGARTKKGNTFSPDSIREIIINPVYTGLVWYNRFEGWSEKRRRGKNSQPIIAEGRHEAIIDRATWDKAMAIFKGKSKAPKRIHSGENVLSGLLRCPECGAPMVVSRSQYRLKNGTKVYQRYYSCGTFKAKGSSVCHANSIRADEAEAYVLQRLKTVLTHPKILADIVGKANSCLSGGHKERVLEYQGLQKRSEELQRKKQKLMDVYDLEGMDRASLSQRMEVLEEELRQCFLRRKELESSLGTGAAEELTVAKVQALLEQLDQLLKKVPASEQKLLLRMAIEKVTLNAKRKIDQIVLNFGESFNHHFLTEDPSAEKAAGSSSFKQKSCCFRVVI